MGYSFGDFMSDIGRNPMIGVVDKAVGTVGNLAGSVVGIFGSVLKGITGFFSGNTFIIIACVVGGIAVIYLFKK
jgi:hypothetical protein